MTDKKRYRVVIPYGRPAEWLPIYESNWFALAWLYAFWHVSTDRFSLGARVMERR